MSVCLQGAEFTRGDTLQCNRNWPNSHHPLVQRNSECDHRQAEAVEQGVWNWKLVRSGMSRLAGFKGWLTRAMPPSEDTCDSDRESIVVSAGVSAGGHAVHEVSASSGVPHTRNSTPTGGNAEVVLHSGIPALSQNNSNKSVSALVLELSAFEGKLRKARSTLQAGFHENKERQQNKHWGASSAHEGSPARSQSINSVNSSHLSESIHRLQTPGSMGSDPPWTEELIQELFQTSRRMEELETEVEEGARMLDVANVRLAEQLMLCTTVSAKLMWPADTPSNSVPGITSLPGNDAACSDDSFAVASDFRIPARGAVTPSDDPIESLSPSESGGVEQGELDLEQVIPFSPTADMDAFQQGPYSPAQQSTWLAFRPQREDSIQAPHLGGDLRTALYDRLGKYMFRQRKRIAGKRYLQHWHETCAWEIELRKALAQVEIGLQHRLLRRVVQGWWRGVQHECDWDCGFCGTPAKVAAHEQICDAMLLATAWKHDTTLSIRGSAVDADIFHHRLKGWLPHESSTGSHPSVFSATSKLRSWLPSVICQYEDDDQSESDRVECWTSMRSRLVLDRLIMMVRGTDEEAATMMQDSIENGSTDDAADQVAAVLARTSVIAVRRSLMGDGAEVASRFLQILDDFDKFRQTPEEQEELCGVGIRLTDHVPMAIADILPHGPAGKCGILRVGDIISKIDGYAVSNTRIDQCRSMIAGRKGTMVSFEFLRKVSDSGMKSLSVDLCRAPLELVSRANWVEKHPKARLLDSGTAKGSQDQTPQAKQDFIALHVSMIVQRIVLAAVFGREQALIEDRVKEMAERISVLESERDRDALNTMEVQTKLVEAQHELSLLRGTGSSPSLTSNLSSRRQSSAPHEQTTSSFTSLPPGWKQYWSKSKNKPYYKQKGISATFWRIPESEITHIAPGKPRATELEPLPETVEEGEVCGEAVAGFQSGRTELVQKWGCEFGCGFIGNFEEVSQHEASCRLIPKVEASWDEMNYLTQQVKTYQAKHSRMEQGCALLQQDLKQLESIVSTLKAGLKLSYQEAQEAKALAFKLETELEVSEVLLKSRQEELERIYELINAGNLEAIENSILESPTCELSLQTAPDPATLLQGETYSTQYVAEEIEKRQQQLMLEIESRQALERELLSLKTSHDESIHKYSLHARKLQERVDELETKLQNAPVFKDDSSPPTDTALGLSQETKWVHTFGCEFRCGFSGSFEDVSNHETNCSFRQETKHTSTGPIQDRDLQTALEQAIDREQALILQLSTLKAREEIFERDLSRLQAELEVSRAPVNKKDEETETNKVTSSGEADGLEHESFSVDMPPVLQNDYTQMKASLEIANVQMQTLGMELRLISSELSQMLPTSEDKGVKRGFDCWLEYLEVMAQERAVEAQERARQELSDSAKATRTKLDAERERRNEICKRVVQRMLWHQLSMAWNEFVHCVQTSRAKKATVLRVLGRMQHRQLAGAFDSYAGAVQSVATHREHLSKTVSRWRSPHVKRGFECWLEYLEVMAQERAVEAQERARQELSDSAKATRSKLKALQERNARWSSYAQRYLLKISVYKAFHFWKAEIRHLCCSNRQALCILNYIHNSMVRRAFQKWSYEMISTVFVRDKIYCADQKHAMELRLQIMTVWAHTCKANSLCKLKASRIRARCCNQQIFTAFLRWWHLLYWDATARRLSTRFSKLRAVSCLQQWSARAKHHRERFMKVIRHKQRRRHQFQAESWQTWACLSSSQRLRDRSHMFCGRLQRRRRLSAVFARWMRFTAGRVRQILEQGWEESNRKPFHVVVCPPKRCILNHYVDLWTAGVSYRLKKQNKVKKACRCFRLCTSAQTLSRWQDRVAHNRLQRQKIYQLIKSHRLAELSAAMYRWLLAVCRSLPDLPHHIDDRLYKDSQLKASPMLLPVTSGQSTRSSPNYELAHGESALHSAVKPISPALSLGSASVFQKMTDDSHDGKAPSSWDTSSFAANTSAGIAFSSDDDSEDERPPLRVSDRARAWGRDWVVSLSAMRATPPAVPSSRSPEHRRSSSGHSRSQKSMDDKRALFGSRSGVPHRHPESPEGQNLAFNHYVSGTLPSAELRHRPIPCLRSSSKEKESVVLDFGRTETSSSQTTRASPHNAAKTPKTRSPDLTFLKQNLRRLYD